MDTQYIFLTVWFLVFILIAFFFIRKGQEALNIFPDISSVKVLFHEKRVSGYSTKSWRTRFGGAQHVLEIVLTKRELWIKSNRVFAGIGSMYDLLHKVSLKLVNVKSVQGSMVVVEIKGSNGNARNIHLRMRNVEEFVIALKKAKQKSANY